MHVLVNVSTIDADIPHDRTCTFDGGERDFIKHPSYAAYGFALHRHKNFIDDKAKRRVYKKHQDATPKLIAKICAGIKKSPFTKRAIKDGYDACVRATKKRKKRGP